MSRPPESVSDRPAEAEMILRLMDAVEPDCVISQRSLAQRLGIALGLANALVKRCARKGLVKITEAPARRYAYYLTPRGLREKSRLVGEYVTISLGFFRRVRGDYETLWRDAEQLRAQPRIILQGATELAEIATVLGHSYGQPPVAVLDASCNHTTFCGIPVIRDLAEAEPFDAVALCSQHGSQETYDALVAELGAKRVLAPRFMYISRPRASDDATADPSTDTDG